MERNVNLVGSDVDRIASHLRSQIIVLHNVLGMIEHLNCYESNHISSSIKTVERELRRLRHIVK